MFCWLNDRSVLFLLCRPETTRDCQSLYLPRSAGSEPTLLFLVTVPVSPKPTLSKKNTGSVVSRKPKPTVLIPKESLNALGFSHLQV